MGWPEDIRKLEAWKTMTEAGRTTGEESKPAEMIAFGSDVAGVAEMSKRALAALDGIKGLSGTGVMTGLNVVGFFATAYSQYQQSTAQSGFMKGVDAVGAGAMDVVIGSLEYKLGAAAPLLPVVDFLLEKGVEAAFGVKGFSIAATEGTAIRATTTMIDGFLTGDTAGMESFHERSMNGDYGPIFKAASHVGEWLREPGAAVLNSSALKPIDFDELQMEVIRQRHRG